MAGNDRKEFSVSFSAADILIVADALSIGSTTALMYGAKAAQKRLDELRARFRAMSPLPKSDRSEGYEWFAACNAIRAARWFEAYAEPMPQSYNKGKSRIMIQVDSSRHTVCEDIPTDEAEASVPAINEFLSEVCGLDTEQLVRVEIDVILPDDGGHRWGDGLIQSVSAAADELLSGVATFHVRQAVMDYSKQGDIARVVLSVPAGDAANVSQLAVRAMEETRMPEAAGPSR